MPIKYIIYSFSSVAECWIKIVLAGPFNMASDSDVNKLVIKSIFLLGEWGSVILF